MKKVLVTGASGFIGEYVIVELLKNNYSVIATSTSAEKVKQRAWFSKVKFVPFNFKNYSADANYFQYFDKPDALIHLAWEGLPNYKSLFHFEENLPRHYAFIKNLVLNGLSDVTVTGTCFEYGFKQGCLTEETDTNPTNAYAIAKDALHKFLTQLQLYNPFVLKWVRLFYMHGKGQNPNSIFSQLEKAIENKQDTFNMSGGEQIRDYLRVEEVAEYIAKIAMQNKITGAINCCSGKPVKLKELIKNYLEEKKTNIHLNLGYYPYLDYEPMSFWGDNTKLKTIINNG
ncbi:NAD-dependent epimerase/dehydratase family protein [Segetibacter koreensis]|uniref:NAD-dependent epimerase/dehydratase family protein n=1 Tax=Segetibacter koreensis TaxID=398037 RepID=UPI00035FB788|nr:NAD(P)-dependent oxidoreductase [Segetibacter koreensis]